MDIVKIFDLQLFAEGAATSGAAVGSTGDGSTGDVGATGDSAVTAKSKNKSKSDPFENVKFGIQKTESDPEAEGTSSETTDEEGSAEESTDSKDVSSTDEANKPKMYTEEEHKQALDREMKRRYKARNKALEPILRYASEALGVDIDDIDGMGMAAESARKQRYQDEAARTGNDAATIETNADNAYNVRNYREELNAIKERNEAQAFNERMRGQEDALREIYPDFKFETEISGEKGSVFRNLLKLGFSMQNAYESVYPEKKENRIRADALKEATDKVTASVAAGANRPAESGIANSSAQVLADPKNLTKAQRAELKKRVRRGEKIIW